MPRSSLQVPLVTALTMGIFASLTSHAAAQGYPWPTGPGEPLAMYENQPLWPYSPPFLDHTGRVVDSLWTQDYQVTPRTLRGKGMSVASEHGRVYARIGEHFVAWDLATFFTEDLGQPLVSTAVDARTRFGPPEQHLAWDAHTYPEEARSGWSTYVLDGQARLYGYAWDHRGYAYVAYSIWGFGVLDAQTLALVDQVDWTETSVSPHEITVFEAGGGVYLIVSGGVANGWEIWNVADPTAPVLVRATADQRVLAATTGSADSEDVVALVTAAYVPELGRVATDLEIHRASDLVAGAAALSITREPSGWRYLDVTTDGEHFFVLSIPTTGHRFAIDIRTPTGTGGALSYTTASVEYDGLAAQGLRYGAGHLTTWGSTADRYEDVRLFRVDGADLVERPLGDFISRHYTQTTVDGYYTPLPDGRIDVQEAVYARHAGHDYLMLSLYGLGDVFEIEPPELDPDGGAPGPDGGAPDPDGGVTADGGRFDAGAGDAGTDSRSDGGTSDVGRSTAEAGCGCASTPGAPGPSWLAALALAFAATRRRRRALAVTWSRR